jgi:hypothetical protein
LYGLAAIALRKHLSTPLAHPTKNEKPCLLNAFSKLLHTLAGISLLREPAKTTARLGTENRNRPALSAAQSAAFLETGTEKVTICYTSIV